MRNRDEKSQRHCDSQPRANLRHGTPEQYESQRQCHGQIHPVIKIGIEEESVKNARERHYPFLFSALENQQEEDERRKIERHRKLGVFHAREVER